VIAALTRRRAPARRATSLPAERLSSAMRTGLRHAANNRLLWATLARAIAIARARVAQSRRLLAAWRRPVRIALLNLSAGSDVARLAGARHQVSAAITARLAAVKIHSGAAAP